MQVKIIVQNSRDVFPAKKNGVLYFSSNFTIKKKKKKSKDVEWHSAHNSPYNKYLVKPGSIWVLIYFNFCMQYYAGPRLLYFLWIQ